VALRLRQVKGIWIALCAAETDEQEGDIYLDDNLHYALSCKFARENVGEWSDPQHAVLAETQKKRDAKQELVAWLERG